MQPIHPEIIINLILQGLGTWLVIPMKFFSFLGNEGFFLFFMPAIYWCLSPALGLRLAVALLLSSSINLSLKYTFHLPRPYWLDSRVLALSAETTFGMPSNHAQNAAVIWGFLAINAHKKLWKVIAALTIFFIGLSRLYLGVHFLSDVVVGWLLGFALLGLFLRLEKTVAAWYKRQPLHLLIGCILTGSLIVFAVMAAPALIFRTGILPSFWQTKALSAASNSVFDPYNLTPAASLAGACMGLFTGAAVCARTGGWSALPDKPAHLLLRYLIGLAGLIILWIGLEIPFLSSGNILAYPLQYARHVLVGMWTTLFAPLLFRRLRLIRS